MQSHKIIILLKLYKSKLKKQRAPLPMLLCNLDARTIETMKQMYSNMEIKHDVDILVHSNFHVTCLREEFCSF